MNKEYAEQGYYHHRRLFDPEIIHSIKQQIDLVFETYTGKPVSDESVIELFRNDFDGFHGCAQACQNLLSLCRLQCHFVMMNAIYDLGLELLSINTRPLLSVSSRHTAKSDIHWRVPAHQDWPSVQGSINGVTCWMPLVDVTPELGPLEVAAGTHLLGYLDHDDVGVPVLNGDYKFTPIEMSVGDALFFNAFTVHRSGNNVSDRIRWSMHFRYNDLRESTFIDRKYPRHRIDKRKEGILYPGFPSSEVMQSHFIAKPMPDNPNPLPL